MENNWKKMNEKNKSSFSLTCLCLPKEIIFNHRKFLDLIAFKKNERKMDISN